MKVFRSNFRQYRLQFFSLFGSHAFRFTIIITYFGIPYFKKEYWDFA